MNVLLGWMLRIFGAFLWLSLFFMWKDPNPGWVSDAARFFFYAITSLGGLACFGGAECLLSGDSSDPKVSVGVIVPLDRDNEQ